jgi:hypothetical protein
LDARWIALGLFVCGVAGCQPGSGVPLGRVTGQVYFYGLPAQAELLFQPVNDADVPTGRPSTAFTSSNGRYDLNFTEAERGAQLGRHVVTVKITAAPDFVAALDREPTIEAIRVTRLVRHVQAGKNTFDFALCF